ncbi:MAG: tRNA 2-thiouridine(34) synthase MnmA [Nitrospiraceae bacterium]|nr:MAG: tRNA 2-thiouridine(34) synthase MnmA [Nitrospiraceae bacterium]
MKVIVAMSGGVDSSVAAYLLKKQGHEVTGLSFELWDRRDLQGSNVCCSVETIELAKAVAKRVGIEHYTVDVRDAFYTHVIEGFCEAYLDGITPNPCILCNKYIKFDFLLQKAGELGAELVATGHYARIERGERREARGKGEKIQDSKFKIQEARYSLLKGIDSKKDQSYVLYVMKQEELSKTLFPLGGLRKENTRDIAKELGLETALRPESQEICFVGNEKYIDFIKGFAPESLNPGPVVNMEGKVLGEHKGIAFYTIGQRKRLGISSLKPHYVVRIDRVKNTVVVGSKVDAMVKNFRVTALNWISVDTLAGPVRASVKVRSAMKEAPAILTPEKDGGVFVGFDEPQWAPAPGQSAVFYDDDIVLGGGIIR